MQGKDVRERDRSEHKEAKKRKRNEKQLKNKSGLRSPRKRKKLNIESH